MLSESEYRQLADLARLDADDEALCQTRLEFNTILEYINKIEKIKIKLPSEVKQKDSASPSHEKPTDAPSPTELSEEQIAEFAPQWEGKHFVVPGAIASED